MYFPIIPTYSPSLAHSSFPRSLHFALCPPCSLGSENFRDSGIYPRGDVDEPHLGKEARDSAATETTSEMRAFDVLQPSMDVFSMGCVIAELFLDGDPLFDLSSLLKYRAGDETLLHARLATIDDPLVVELVMHMVRINPSDRLTVPELLAQFQTNQFFPPYFSGFLYEFMAEMVGDSMASPDARVHAVAEQYGDILREIAGFTDVPGEYYFANRLREGGVSAAPPPSRASRTSRATGTGSVVAGETKENAASVGGGGDGDGGNGDAPPPNTMEVAVGGDLPVEYPGGLLVVISLLCSSLQYVKGPELRITGIWLMVRLSSKAGPVADEARLHSVVPYLVNFLGDRSARVRAVAVSALSEVLSMVRALPQSDANIFPDYILPALRRMPSDTDELVRLAFAENMPRLALCSKRFLEIAQMTKQHGMQADGGGIDAPLASAAGGGGVGKVIEGSYDYELRRLHEEVFKNMQSQLDPTSQAERASLEKRTVLRSIVKLALFFGREETQNQIIPIVITFLNQPNWQLRATLLEQLSGIIAFVGRVLLREYLFPCIESTLLRDTDEYVVYCVLHCLATLCELDMLGTNNRCVSKSDLELAQKVAPLLLHPSGWIRHGTVRFLAALWDQLGKPPHPPCDRHVFLMPLLRPYLTSDCFAVPRIIGASGGGGGGNGGGEGSGTNGSSAAVSGTGNERGLTRVGRLLQTETGKTLLNALQVSDSCVCVCVCVCVLSVTC